MRGVFAKYLDYGEGPTGAIMLDNADWLDELNYLGFLRDIGRHFSVNRMLSFESVKSRLDRDQSLSFLEFNYMILQAYDFLELHRREGCLLQMGGSDQWGNIVNGIDLTRRVAGAEVFGLTSPLLTTADGAQDGQDRRRRRLAQRRDARALRLLAVLAQHRRRRRRPLPQALHRAAGRGMRPPRRASAAPRSTPPRSRSRTRSPALCHGPEAAAAAEATARAVFEEGGTGEDLPTLTLAPGDIPAGGIPVVQLLVRAGLAGSGKDARRLIAEGGARLDDAAADRRRPAPRRRRARRDPQALRRPQAPRARPAGRTLGGRAVSGGWLMAEASATRSSPSPTRVALGIAGDELRLRTPSPGSAPARRTTSCSSSSTSPG